MSRVLTLFDLDGTLVELWDVHVKVYESMFIEVYGLHGIDFRKKYAPGGTSESTVNDVLTYLGYRRDFIDANIRQVMPALERLYVPAIKKGKVNVLPGIEELLNALQERGIPKGVVTGNRQSATDLILRKAGLDNFFLFTATADNSEDREERLRMAIAKAEYMQSCKYQRGYIYFFDDSYASIPVSRKLGIKSVAVASDEIPYERLFAAEPDYLFRNLTNIEEILKILLQK